MQTLGHIFIGGIKILVLVRINKYTTTIKRRYSGKDGVYLPSEQEYVCNDIDKTNALLRGDIVGG